MQTTLEIEEAAPITLESMTSMAEMMQFKHYCQQSARMVKSSEVARKHYEGLLQAVVAHEELRKILEVARERWGLGVSAQDIARFIQEKDIS